MPDVTKDPQPYTDTGTGAYEPPPAETTVESPADVEPTGEVEAPPAEVTTTSPAGDEVTESTGAFPGPEPQTRYEWPATDPDAGKKQVKASDTEDKAVKRPRTKGA